MSGTDAHDSAICSANLTLFIEQALPLFCSINFANWENHGSLILNVDRKETCMSCEKFAMTSFSKQACIKFSGVNASSREPPELPSE
ncbi:hypothetical protein D3C84_926110 [compost metagenome]